MKDQLFSQRTNWDTSESEWARLLRERRASGLPVFDLTASNPTRCGFDYDQADIRAALSDPGALEYDPDPRGMALARQAVREYYAGHRAEVALDRIFLTTSTSEAYSYLFRLLCDPGDEVLIAQPSYPLFDFLADLDGVRLVIYPLFYDYGWHVDIETLRSRITPQTRAIAMVHPNNPTGNFYKAVERAEIEKLCAEHRLALIVDEVFLDYCLDDSIPVCDRGSFAARQHHPCLTFVLSGLSKVAALPQMKAAWIACLGPDTAVGLASERLEVIADSFLSMNAPVQCALPTLLRLRERLQRQIRARTTANLAAMDKLLAGKNSDRLVVEAGWSAVLRIPAIYESQTTALDLLARGVAIHAGYFFGFKGSGWLVVSLLTHPEPFLFGINEIIQYAEALV